MVNLASDTAQRELVISRILDAPRELVWEAWINPEHLKNWWGPTGFTNTIHTMDVRPGGVWELTMHGPDGKNYPNHSIFLEVVEMERIVFEHTAPHFMATITFIADGDKTLLSWHMLFDRPEDLEVVVKHHKADQGLRQNVEKFQAYLAGLK
jgi:uncharacterized protein YndB with AHSA1/START domain